MFNTFLLYQNMDSILKMVIILVILHLYYASILTILLLIFFILYQIQLLIHLVLFFYTQVYLVLLHNIMMVVMEIIILLLYNLHLINYLNLPSCHTLKIFLLIFNIINDVFYISILIDVSQVNIQALNFYTIILSLLYNLIQFNAFLIIMMFQHLIPLNLIMN